MKRGNGVRYPGICRRAEGNILFRVEFNWSPGTRPRFEHENTFTSTYFRSVSPFTGRQNARMRPRNEQTVQTSPTGRSNWLIKCHSRIWPASLSIFPEEKVFFQPARGETYLSVSLVRIGYRIGGEKFTNSSG